MTLQSTGLPPTTRPCCSSLSRLSRFIDSEADLDGAIKALLPLSQSSGLAYPELARSNAMPLLIGLLSHENLDIVIDAVELLYELTEENADAEYDDDEVEEEEAALKILVDSLVSTCNSDKRKGIDISSGRTLLLGAPG